MEYEHDRSNATYKVRLIKYFNIILSARELSWMDQPEMKTTRCESVTSAKEELRYCVSKIAKLDGSVRKEDNQMYVSDVSQRRTKALSL
jgi:hypothetical protein